MKIPVKNKPATKTMHKNKQVLVSLRGCLENGEVFEETPDDLPLSILLGQSRFFPVLEQALEKMRPGDTETIKLAPEDAYGPHHKNLVQVIDLSGTGLNIRPQPGMILSLNMERNGKPEKVPATVVGIAGNKVTIDFNHPLAGKTVIYTLTMHEILG